MSKREFTKAALSIPELIAFLEDRGLMIKDRSAAGRYLAYIGFYRLKIYMRPFENGSTKRFRPGITLEDVVSVYDFDRRLRLLCLDAIERVEVALRAHMINHMGHHGGPHFYYDERYFDNRDAVTAMRGRGERGKHLSIMHYKKEYDRPHLPPIWCITEDSSFGELSKWYADLGKSYRKEIARSFDLHEGLCVSWFRTLTTLRNICAHHGRLWNASLHANMPMKAKAFSRELQDNKSCYSRLIVLIVLLNRIDPSGDYGWKPRLIELIKTRPNSVDLRSMGFPEDWDKREIWAVASNPRPCGLRRMWTRLFSRRDVS